MCSGGRSQLSKGMAAKTKLIVAMARHPDLLVLDEPTSGLDPNSRYDLLDTIRAEATERGVTTVFSSHNLDEVERIATHVGVIHRGRMILEASMDSLKSQFTTVRGAEPDAALHPRVAGHADLDGAPAWLIEGQGSPELEAFAAQHPQAELNPASFSEMFRLVTHDVRPAPAPTP
ncbi:MAG: AAA family ATPase [Planctomycetota bacterium]